MNSSVGTSAITPFKQEDLCNLLNDQIGFAFGVYQKWGKEKYYNNDCYQNCFIDCTAGDMNPNSKTSPRTFLNKLREFKNYPSKLTLIEEKPETFIELSNNVNTENKQSGYYISPSLFIDDFYLQNNVKIPPDLKVLNISMQKYLSELHPNKYRYGLLYFDSNGFQMEEYNAVFNFLKQNPRMDVILNINTSKLNGLRNIHKNPHFKVYHNFYLNNLFQNLKKDYIWIRDNVKLKDIEDHCHYKYLMIFGTNTEKIILPKKYNFVLLNSKLDNDKKRIENILNNYNLTQKEKENGINSTN